MQVSPVGQLSPVLPAVNSGQQETGQEGSFSKILNNAISKLNNTQVVADNLALELLTGDIQDIHQVTIAMQEAKLSMQLAVEVRNKVIEAYQEISRMQI
ncbi:MAG: flagellar hook-basal body complex protein FliE [Desulfotomaculaceae bacterium]|nr:flagellar hook-basal body complex protein FliE [Desulfotomaculaceae bacterium]